MPKKQNPVTGNRDRVSGIQSLARVDARDPIENLIETQSETLAVRAVMKRFPVSIWHAQVICRVSGLGGAA